MVSLASRPTAKNAASAAMAWAASEADDAWDEAAAVGDSAGVASAPLDDDDDDTGGGVAIACDENEKTPSTAPRLLRRTAEVAGDAAGDASDEVADAVVAGTRFDAHAGLSHALMPEPRTRRMRNELVCGRKNVASALGCTKHL